MRQPTNDCSESFQQHSFCYVRTDAPKSFTRRSVSTHQGTTRIHERLIAATDSWLKNRAQLSFMQIRPYVTICISGLRSARLKIQSLFSWARDLHYVLMDDSMHLVYRSLFGMSHLDDFVIIHGSRSRSRLFFAWILLKDPSAGQMSPCSYRYAPTSLASSGLEVSNASPSFVDAPNGQLGDTDPRAGLRSASRQNCPTSSSL